MFKEKKISTHDIVFVAVSVAILAICSWIRVPTTVPFTLQTFAVFTIIGIFGMKRSVLTVVVYILLGAVGVPVFAGFNGGLAYLAGNTGGYIIGFLFTAFISGLIIKVFGKKTPVMFIAMVVGLVLCYAFGTAWFMFFYTRNVEEIGIMTALSWCIIPFIIPDLIKIIVAIIVSKRVGKSLKGL